MAVALYTKYRPATFDSVVGQHHVLQTLKNAIEGNRISHAYLFCGPRGTGKTTMARILAKACICQNSADGKLPTTKPCGTCDNCTDIAAGSHEDVAELDAASRTGVDNVREEIINRVSYAPTRASKKIYIIDEVHMLSTAAFNALLKTLEEPPEHVIFILCTTDPQKVPETILSRCQRFDFRPISNEDVVSRLHEICQSEGVEAEDEALNLIAKKSLGGMRNALTQLEQLISFCGGKITAADVEGKDSVGGQADVTELLQLVASNDLAGVFNWVSNFCNFGADFDGLTNELIENYRDIYISLSGGTVNSQVLLSVAQAYTKERAHYILSLLSDVSSELRSSLNKRLTFEVAMAKATRLDSVENIESLNARIAELGAKIDKLSQGEAVVPSVSEPEPQPTVASQPAEEAASITPETKPEPWQEPIETDSINKIPDIPPVFNGENEQTVEEPVAEPQSEPSVPAAQPEPSVSGQQIDLTDTNKVEALWNSAYSQIKEKYPMYAALLQRGHLVYDEITTDLIIELPANQSFYADTFKKSENIAKLKAIFEKLVDANFGLSVKARDNSTDKPSVVDILREAGATNITTK